MDSPEDGLERNPIVLVRRHLVQARLDALFRPGDRVVDVGCGTGEAAVLLAARGVRVVGVDPSPEAIARARARAAAGGLSPDVCRFELSPLVDLDVAGTDLDGAYSSLGALHGTDLGTAGRALGAALRAGAPVLLSLPGPSPLPASVRRALTGMGERRRARAPWLDGDPAPAVYPTTAEARRALGPALVWTNAYAIGLLVPAPEHAGWAAAHPQAFGALAALERGLRRWPGLRDLGDVLVLEGRRASSP
jgi:SAM-dependent methyltransferase